MPIYSFVCNKCGETFDLLVNVIDIKENPKCEKCGSVKTTRTFSSFAVGSTKNNCEHSSCDISNKSPGCCPGCKFK